MQELDDHVFRVDFLPDGPGILPPECSERGPWYGVHMPGGYDYGWYRYRAAAESFASQVWAEYNAKQRTGPENNTQR